MYHLHDLGWKSFQQLCHTIVSEVLGQTVESYLDSHDAGRDGAFTGTWNTTGQEDLSGPFVIQCKFTSRINHKLTASDIKDEVEKAQKLVEQGICESYVLMTNAGLSGPRANEIKSLFKDAGAKHVAAFESMWIERQIRENSRLRMHVPRIYGLGDLSQILDERAYTQARAILESLREDLAKVVVTNAYRRAMTALDHHGFVLLIGEPAAGKTTIASLLAMAALDQWKAALLKLDDPEQMARHWNPDEPSQFFWLDDAFGVTQYETFLVHRWNHILPRIKAMLNKGARIVMTSRDYIYRRARQELKESAFPLLHESKVVIDVQELSADERRQILYNHIKLGKQPQSFRTEIKPHLEAIASHARFIPETARRLADPLFTRDLFIASYHLDAFVAQREQLLQEVIQGLDRESKALLALIYMRHGQLASPIRLLASESEALARLGSDLGGCVAALDALKDSLVRLSPSNGESYWQFKHPTIGDAFAALLVSSPELLGIYLQGSPPTQLVQQVTCGDVGLENALVVPTSLHELVLARLSEITADKDYKHPALSQWGAERALLRFLARRCCREFLAVYIERNPELLSKVSKPGLYLDSVPEVDLAQRLYELDLLPEEHRRGFVETVSEYTRTGEDTEALDDSRIKSIFTKEEFEELLRSVRRDLLPRIGEVRHGWEINSPSEVPPDEYMQPFLDSLDRLQKQFRNEPLAARIIERERGRAMEWIEEHSTGDQYKTLRDLGRIEPPHGLRSERSIFDDIDAEPGGDPEPTAQ